MTIGARILGSMLLCWALTGHAQAAVCGPYRVAFHEFGSLYFKDATGQYVGIDKDVVDEVSRRSGCRLEGFLDSRIKTWKHMEAGFLDMTVSALSNPERVRFAQFAPYLRTRKLLVVHAGGAVTSLEAFANRSQLRLAVGKAFRHGAALDAWVDALRTQGRVDEYTDAEAVVRVFALGRADAFIADPIGDRPLLLRNGLEGRVGYLEPVGQESSVAGLAFSRKRVAEADVQTMRLALESMRKDGTLLAILRRHLPPEAAMQLLP